MKLLKLEVYNHNRFHLNPELKHFIYVPGATNQVIIGSNGSGKTTLLSLIYGWPVEAKDLGENGYVIQTIQSGTAVYILESRRVANGARYSFIKDAVELNEPAKITIQRNLVTQILGVDKDLVKLATSQEVLTEMSPSRRKDWFIRTAKSDFDFILKTFDSVNRKVASTKTLLNHANDKLVKLNTQEELTPEAVEAKLDEINNLKLQVEDLLATKPVEFPTGDYQPEILAKRTQDLIQLNRDFKEQYRNTRQAALDANISYAAIKDIENLRAATANTLRHAETAVKDTLSELERKANLNEQLKLIAKPEDLLEELKQLPDDLPNAISCEPQEFSEAKALLPGLELLAKGLVTPTCTYEELLAYQAEYQTLVERKEWLKKSLEALRAETSALNLELQERLECPKCSHKWSLNQASSKRNPEVALKAATQRLTEHSEELDTRVAPRVEELSERISLNKQVFAVHKEIRIRIHRAGLSQLETPKDLDSINATEIINVLGVMIEGFSAHVINLNIARKRKDLQAQIRTCNELETAASNAATIDDSVLNLKLDRSYDTIATAQHRLAAIDRIIGLRDTTLATSVAIKNLMNANNRYITEAKTLRYIQAVNESVMELKTNIAALEFEYQEYQQRSRNVERLEAEVKEHSTTLADYKTLATQIGPKGGLIGRSVLGYMETFVRLMNKHLNAMWEHDLLLTMPDVTKLDYNFPIKIGQAGSKDVSETSAGQADAINLAYKLTMMDLLGVSHYPLMLDEFGVHLDKTNRGNAYRYIQNLSRKSYSNLFMVSHYPDLYVGLSADTEYNVLDRKNIDLAEVPNELNISLQIQF